MHSNGSSCISLKSVILWNAKDINSILRLGQIYYENSMSHLLENTPRYDSTYLEVAHLLKNLEINFHQIEVFIESTQCRGGPHTEENFVDAIHNFEQCQFKSGVIIYLGFSYGILRLYNTDGTSAYVFFDSHGRLNDGSKNGTKAAIMFFRNSNDFINFF
jgi:hypothetical protein